MRYCVSHANFVHQIGDCHATAMQIHQQNKRASEQANMQACKQPLLSYRSPPRLPKLCTALETSVKVRLTPARRTIQCNIAGKGVHLALQGEQEQVHRVLTITFRRGKLAKPKQLRVLSSSSVSQQAWGHDRHLLTKMAAA